MINKTQLSNLTKTELNFKFSVIGTKLEGSFKETLKKLWNNGPIWTYITEYYITTLTIAYTLGIYLYTEINSSIIFVMLSPQNNKNWLCLKKTNKQTNILTCLQWIQDIIQYIYIKRNIVYWNVTLHKICIVICNNTSSPAGDTECSLTVSAFLKL